MTLVDPGLGLHPIMEGRLLPACKPDLVHFLLRTVVEHRLSGLDSRVGALGPRLDGLNEAL
jgi:hypothetical protein